MEDDEYYLKDWEPEEPKFSRPEADEETPGTLDTYLAAQVLVPWEGEMVRAKVIGRKRDHDGNPIGTRHSNPIMDTRKYTLELPNGELTNYTANLIAEHMYAQTDSEGYEHMLLHEITDHKKDGQAVSAYDG